MSTSAIPTDQPGTILGHPKGLAICFMTEMWERFSYYGMRALLIFYLTQHFLFSDEVAAGIFGAYISLVYITPVVGGIVADRYLGPAKAVILGALFLVAGHFGMALEGIPAVEINTGGELQVERNAFFLQTFYFSLALIIMGVGFLKANISTLVGSMYKRKDPRRDGGFTLFYMGINLGAFLGAIICGFLLEYRGFSWGFGAAGVGMLFGLLIFIRGQHLFGERGGPTNPAWLKEKLVPGINREVFIYLLAIAGVIVCWQLMQYRAVVGGLLGLSLVLMTLVVVAYAFMKCEPMDRNRMLVCLFLMSYQIIFWSLFEQTGSSLNLMTDRNVDRVVFGFEIPAAVFQSVNAFFIITLAPLFNALWIYLARNGWEPTTPMKFALSLIQLGLGFLFLVYGASLAGDPTQVALVWLVMLYFLHTTGELCISPVGLSMTTKLSMPKVVGMMMGCWFLASAAGNYVSGIIAAMTGSETVSGEVTDPGAALASYVEVYSTAGWYSIAAGVFAIFLVPLLKRFMHGIR
ncbi:MAG: peptide MFS transporter [Gammaproteobacteria bacterium]|jgi:POT family proton-dependent oligopeptide transporter|nr:MFS transporter [Gammaproteobacteria bacterium]MDP6098098.1 peptide MFS transporter [Gammaproteobacteria bacterium]MDP7455660.1 peptide MFS transporter [Gammaproteobacteria bacterium]